MNTKKTTIREITTHKITDNDQILNEEINGKLPNKEFGGRKGLEPTRYGDWEKNGRCIDF